MVLTKLQILWILYLRHEKFCGCSWRSLAANFYNRYNKDNTFKSLEERERFDIMTFGGNQIDGMYLERLAVQQLVGVTNTVGESMYGLCDLDLNFILPEFNLKRHLDGEKED